MKNFILTACLIILSVSTLSAQDTTVVRKSFGEQEKLQIKLKTDADPDFYIDGVKYDAKIFNLLDPNKIESVSVLKGDQALEKYNAPNGVVLITTKSAAKADSVKAADKLGIRDYGYSNKKDPMVIIDGEVSSHKVLSELEPATIKSITVFKQKAAIEMYNAPEGVIIVETKKGKK
ncbi:TonB-dependent receptor plug domain-containing protein [Saccharicrinis sp. FJH62]|uniref:TonB-dependent receptor plug domain-containing protein n=1 Tax=Saccharicrinis sp. FJH62 TaxID=3344657 RepID=UPI0035D493EA